MRYLLFAAALGLAGTAAGSRISERALTLEGGCRGWLGFGRAAPVTVAVTEYRPEAGPLRGDILYFHGFADSGRNHRRLFDGWTGAGFRVVAFDFPGHGRTREVGGPASIGGWSIPGLVGLGQAVERATVEDDERPLLLAGWSTGGLVAVAWMQTERESWGPRRPRALILHAPGVAVRTPVGRWSLRYPLGEVTLETLSHDVTSPVEMPIYPRSPGAVPLFGMSLLAATRRVRPWLSAEVPMLVLVGGDDDRYVDTRRVLQWSRPQAYYSYSMQFPRMRHWLDREPEERGGSEVIGVSAEFARWAVEPGAAPRFTFAPRYGVWRQP